MPSKRTPKNVQKVRYSGQRTNNLSSNKVRKAAQLAPVVEAVTPSAPPATAALSLKAGDGTMALPGSTITGVVPPPDEYLVPTRKGKPWTAWRVLRWVLGILGIALLSVVLYLVVKFVDLQGKIVVDVPATPTVAAVVLPPQPTALPGQPTSTVRPSPTPDYVRELPAGKFNILVLGTDKRESDPETYARSDSMVLVNVDSTDRKVRLLSIPRDLIVEIPDYGENKINAAFFLGEYFKEPGGGKALAMRTLSDYFDVTVDYYVTVNFEGFRAIVDQVGGIDVNVPYELDDYSYPSDDEGDPYGTLHVHFDEGWQHMDGKTALRYARTRHADNDFARSKRQLQVVMAIRHKALSLDLLPAVPSILDELAGMVQTNLNWDEQLGLAQLGFGLSASSIITASIDGTMVYGSYLPDGSEGLRLDEDLAVPMLDEFFGFTTPTPSPTATPPRRATPTRTPTRVR